MLLLHIVNPLPRPKLTFKHGSEYQSEVFDLLRILLIGVSPPLWLLNPITNAASPRRRHDLHKDVTGYGPQHSGHQRQTEVAVKQLKIPKNCKKIGHDVED